MPRMKTHCPWSRVTGKLSLCAIAAGVLLGVTAATGCSREPTTPEARRERGDELVKRMSEHLGRAPGFRVEATDVRNRTRGGQQVTVRTTRLLTLRRPDRLAMAVTGDTDLKVWYDGQKLTLVSEREKVWARVNAEPSIDATLDRMAERLGMSLPAADFLYSSPVEGLIGPDSTGGYVGRESVGGVSCVKVAYKDAAAEWELWLPESGDPLPKRFRFTDLTMTPHRAADIVFDKWALGVDSPDAMFVPSVPEGFERIPLAVQAEVTPPDSPAGPTKIER